MTAESLAIWLYGVKVANVEEDRRRAKRPMRLTYTAGALERFSQGSALLSLALPLTTDAYPNGVTRAFVDGLLPEGDLRRVLAESLNLVATDSYGLIGVLGRDCAGALVVQSNDLPTPDDTAAALEPLTEEEVAQLLADLKNAPLGVGQRVRLSLAGVQEKLLLIRRSDGSWCRPVDGRPSTHILKPANDRFPGTVQNEAFCMRFAAELGLSVARVETPTFDGRQVLAVERYDRISRVDGSVERIHQEDFCQVFGFPPGRKYEEDGGPTLRKIADVLQVAAQTGSLDSFLRAVGVNVLIGNGDAHGKNFSLLHRRDGRLEFAPLYDLISTLIYGDEKPAMSIDAVHRIRAVTRERLLNEAARWGMSRQRAAGVLDDLLGRVPAAVAAARAATDGLGDEVPTVVESQLAQLSA